MEVLNYREFRTNLAKCLDRVIDNEAVVIVARSKRKRVVVMDPGDYNAMMETLLITKSEANRIRLQMATDEMNSGVYFAHGMIEA